MKIRGRWSATGTGFSPSTSCFPCLYQFTNAVYSISTLILSEGQAGETWDFKLSCDLFELGKLLTEKYFDIQA